VLQGVAYLCRRRLFGFIHCFIKRLEEKEKKGQERGAEEKERNIKRERVYVCVCVYAREVI